MCTMLSCEPGEMKRVRKPLCDYVLHKNKQTFKNMHKSFRVQEHPPKQTSQLLLRLLRMRMTKFLTKLDLCLSLDSYYFLNCIVLVVLRLHKKIILMYSVPLQVFLTKHLAISTSVFQKLT